jgi:hypothetical protein
MARFADGHPGGPGRPKGKTEGLSPVVRFNLKMAMRELCPRAVGVVRECLNSADEKVRLMACQIAFERGFGRPEQHADVNINANFIVAPAPLSEAAWLAKRQIDLKAAPATRLMDPDAETPPDDPSKVN